ncbi:SUN domain-containing protein 1-like [Impatiens glandulifera]|uniref:SUN domain-containing protein 1-like n=1 Tax=Impatiens glandulifera TaxID=253017 RepID=UPI001FB0FC19|nr:SUN domain-containing protein 1-like [Impatiens glandulifera]
MSTSTVSFTANPALAKRRQVLIGEENRSIKELVVGDGTATSGGKEDFTRSVRGELVMEATRDVIHVKKSLQTSPPRRSSRKPKTERPRWLTILRVLTKNLSILIVLFGLVQMVQKLALRSGNVSDNPPINDSSSEDISVFKQRLLEVEESVKASAKVTEGKVEVVNQKIESEIGGIRVDLNKKIEEQELKLTNELKKLDGRTSNLEESLVKLTTKEWLAKEEFDIFFDEYRKASGLDNSNSHHISLDDMRAFAREVVKDELIKHAADGLGKVDYALASGGGFVMKHSEIYNLGKRTNWFYDNSQVKVHPDAERMLRPSFGEPGQCFALKGNSGFVDVGLRTAIVVEAVTLEHVSKSVAYDRSSAPKDCRVSGWLREGNNNNNGEEKKIHFLTEFTYDLEKSNAQTYEVLESAGTNVVDTIRLEFTSNHGSPAHTCIYRLRVHGHEPSSSTLMVSAQY